MGNTYLFKDELLERLYNKYLNARIDKAKLLGAEEMDIVANLKPEAVLAVLLFEATERIETDIRILENQKKEVHASAISCR